MSNALILIIVFLVVVMLGFPIGMSAFIASLCYIFASGGIQLQVVTQQFVSGMNQYSLLAIPFFVLAGNIMNYGGITDRIFRFCTAIVGHIPGGLGHVNVLSSMLFAGMSGSSTSDAAGLGAVEIRAMKNNGYDVPFSACVTATSSCIGPIIPPSIPAVVYAVQAGISTGALFAAGILPGITMGLTMMIMCYAIGKKRGYHQPKAEFKEVKDSFVSAFFALLAPVIIIGGTLSGIFTPTEAAAITVVYGAIVGAFIYKELKWNMLKDILVETVETTAVLMIIIGAVTLFGWILVRELIPQTICSLILGLSENPIIVMLLLTVFLLVVGCFLSPSAAILVLVPILKPIMTQLGINPLQFGMLVVYVLCIGNVTPPVGNSLYVVAKVADMPSEKLMKAMVPWYIPLLLVALLIVFVPAFTAGIGGLLDL